MAQSRSAAHCAIFTHCPLFSRDSALVNTKMRIQYLLPRYLRNVLDSFADMLYSTETLHLWLPPWKPRDPDAHGRGR